VVQLCTIHSERQGKYCSLTLCNAGTRLLKPPTKLVELVAQAINGSPDGLLQVQQIYIFLQ